MNRSAFDQWFCTALVLAAAALPPAQSLFAAPPQPPIITSGEFILADLDGDGLVDEASIDWITFDVAARTTVNFDALIYESIYAGGDLNGDGEITRADGGMVLFDSNQDVLAQIDDTPGDRASASTTATLTTPSKRQAPTRLPSRRMATS